jgi:methyl-accepting chemotaxis protein
MSDTRRRTKFFIAKRFQIRYISLILFFMLMTALLTGYTVYYTAWVMFGEKLAAVYPQGLLLEIVQKVNTVLFLRLVFLTPLVILIGLVLSNRIAGPIYRIHKYLDALCLGDYSERLKLREKDELQDIAASANDLAAKLDDDKKKREAAIDNLARKVEDKGPEYKTLSTEIERLKIL